MFKLNKWKSKSNSFWENLQLKYICPEQGLHGIKVTVKNIGQGGGMFFETFSDMEQLCWTLKLRTASTLTTT